MLAATLLSSLALANLATALPAPLTIKRDNGKSSANYSQYYDIQGHRGTRGFAVENTLAAFSWGILAGVTTLELDASLSEMRCFDTLLLMSCLSPCRMALQRVR